MIQNNEIARLQKECLQLQKNVQELTTTIDSTKSEENKKLKEEAESHKIKVDEIK